MFWRSLPDEYALDRAGVKKPGEVIEYILTSSQGNIKVTAEENWLTSKRADDITNGCIVDAIKSIETITSCALLTDISDDTIFVSTVCPDLEDFPLYPPDVEGVSYV